MDRRNRDILEAFPSFHRIVNLPWHNAWKGELTPVFQTYKVRIDFAPGMNDGENHYLRCPISIQVIEPKLARRHLAPGLPIPHLYRQPDGDRPPTLCLFWPKDDEWSSLDSIAEFILPWISEWFINYEIWHATGEWASPEAPHDVGAVNLDRAEDIQSLPTKLRSDIQRWHNALAIDLMGSSALPELSYFVHNYCTNLTTK